MESKSLDGWRQMRDADPVRKIVGGAVALITLFGIVAPAYADPAAVNSARASYKTAVAAAEKAQKMAIDKANREYRQALKSASGLIVVANAQAKALAEQATKASSAKSALDQALAAAGSDRQAQAKAIREYDRQVRTIQNETEKALKDARSLAAGKSSREQAQLVRDQAIKTAKETYKAAVQAARVKFNSVLVANGLPADKG